MVRKGCSPPLQETLTAERSHSTGWPDETKSPLPAPDSDNWHKTVFALSEHRSETFRSAEPMLMLGISNSYIL